MFHKAHPTYQYFSTRLQSILFHKTGIFLDTVLRTSNLVVVLHYSSSEPRIFCSTCCKLVSCVLMFERGFCKYKQKFSNPNLKFADQCSVWLFINLFSFIRFHFVWYIDAWVTVVCQYISVQKYGIKVVKLRIVFYNFTCSVVCLLYSHQKLLNCWLEK